MIRYLGRAGLQVKRGCRTVIKVPVRQASPILNKAFSTSIPERNTIDQAAPLHSIPPLVHTRSWCVYRSFARNRGTRHRGPSPEDVLPTQEVIDDWDAKGRLRRVTPYMLDQCMARKDYSGAIFAYDAIIAKGVQLPSVGTFNVVLNACIKESDFAKALCVFDEMLEQGETPDSGTYTAMVTVTCALDMPERALALAKQFHSEGGQLRLRAYTPVLEAYQRLRQDKEAVALVEYLYSLEIPVTAYHYHVLIATAITNNNTDLILDILNMAKGYIPSLLPETTSQLYTYFDALPGFHVHHASVASSTGECSACKHLLHSHNVNEEERTEFLERIEHLAVEAMGHRKTFDQFKQWLEENGPFNAIIDGANVAWYRRALSTVSPSDPVPYSKDFNIAQLQAVVQDCISRGLRVLIVLHGHYTTRHALSQQVPNEIKDKVMVFGSPGGANDDWFWMYAAVKSRDPRTVLVTNDLMRDHVIGLFVPGFFYKWQAKHQVLFEFDNHGLDIRAPPAFSVSLQGACDEREGDRTYTWHLPASKDEATPLELQRALDKGYQPLLSRDSDVSWLCIQYTADQVNNTLSPE